MLWLQAIDRNDNLKASQGSPFLWYHPYRTGHELRVDIAPRELGKDLAKLASALQKIGTNEQLAKLVGEDPDRVFAVQSLFGPVTIVLTWMLGRRLFGAGINLTHLYEGKIRYLWYLIRDLGFVNKLYRGLASPDASPEIASTEKLWIAAVEGFAIGGHCQILLTMDYTIAANDTQLSLNATPQSFTSGETGNVTLSGKLTSGVNGVGAQQVVLEKRPFGATSWGQVGTPTTATDGSFSFSVAKSTITRNTDFRVRFAGSGGYKPSESATQQVQVQARVTLNASATSLRLGREVTFSGTVSPAHPGQRVTVTVVRNTATGSTTVATLSPTLTSNSSYSVRYKPAVRGNYSVVASFSDADHARGESAPRSFSVT